MIHAVSARGQVTIPKPVREAMGVGAGTRLFFEVLDDRRVVLTSAAVASAASQAAPADDDDEPCDPALGPFLGLLDKDIDSR